MMESVICTYFFSLSHELKWFTEHNHKRLFITVSLLFHPVTAISAGLLLCFVISVLQSTRSV